jgi:hypothetical protein|tara:strand:- start:442 stop:600 length:159 start_codon:yes stop_codon:yes gene_type:complete
VIHFYYSFYFNLTAAKAAKYGLFNIPNLQISKNFKTNFSYFAKPEALTKLIA